MLKHNDIHVFENVEKLNAFAADDFCKKAKQSVEAKGSFSVVLSGGQTPNALFDLLSSVKEYQNNIPWAEIQFFFGDERYVPTSDSRSNYHSAYTHLFSKVPVNPKNIHRIPTEHDDPQADAEKYENIIRRELGLSVNEFPKFDLIYLGLGDNAHTASLMPHSDVVSNCIKDKKDNRISPKFVESLYVPELEMNRITLMPYAINQAENIIFLVSGANKASSVWDVLQGERNPLEYPAQLIQGAHSNAQWYLDQVAAEKLLQNDVLCKKY